jgi:hypothetical protein
LFATHNSFTISSEEANRLTPSIIVHPVRQLLSNKSWKLITYSNGGARARQGLESADPEPQNSELLAATSNGSI